MTNDRDETKQGKSQKKTQEVMIKDIRHDTYRGCTIGSNHFTPTGAPQSTIATEELSYQSTIAAEELSYQSTIATEKLSYQPTIATEEPSYQSTIATKELSYQSPVAAEGLSYPTTLKSDVYFVHSTVRQQPLGGEGKIFRSIFFLQWPKNGKLVYNSMNLLIAREIARGAQRATLLTLRTYVRIWVMCLLHGALPMRSVTRATASAVIRTAVFHTPGLSETLPRGETRARFHTEKQQT